VPVLGRDSEIVNGTRDDAEEFIVEDEVGRCLGARTLWDSNPKSGGMRRGIE
jgi:hypothetical protein